MNNINKSLCVSLQPLCDSYDKFMSGEDKSDKLMWKYDVQENQLVVEDSVLWLSRCC